MQEMIAEFNNSMSAEDIFLSWQNELRLRQQIRDSASREAVRIESRDEFKFLQRCLYYGPGQDLFFAILYYNMANLTILNCLLEAPGTLRSDFLKFLAHSFPEIKPSPRDLQFLINIYQEEFRPEFIELIDRMDPEQCLFLISRTGNNDLRRLLKNRQSDIASAKKPAKDIAQDMPVDYPTMYGDKINIIAGAIKALKASQTFDLSVIPFNRSALNSLLKGMDMLFKAGLLADCLLILNRIVTSPDMDEHSLSLSGEQIYYQQIDSLLRKVLPMYSLLVNPFDPHRYALEIYRNLFPGFRPDTASLLYLDIHSFVMAALQGHHRYTNYELAQKGAKILALRPDDEVASILLQSRDKLSSIDLHTLKQALKKRISHYPHEVYTTMEILRLWYGEDRIKFDKKSAARLLNAYRQFFNWIPAAPFMNEQVLNQLGPVADEATRTACERILLAMQESSQANFNNKIPAGKTADDEMNKLHRQLLMSKYMGVF